MDKKRAIELLKEEKKSIELISEITTDNKRAKELKERVQAYDLILNQIEGKQQKVRIKEFLDSNKNWGINVLVNDELIPNENIEFIRKQPSKEVKVVELVIKNDASSIVSNRFLINIEKLILRIKKLIKNFNRSFKGEYLWIKKRC